MKHNIASSDQVTKNVVPVYVVPSYIVIIYAVFSLLYIFAGNAIAAVQGEIIAITIKAIPIVSLFIISLLAKVNKWLSIALFFGACGDVLIGFNFVLGLSAFLIGHIFYIIMWSGQFEFSKFPNTIPVVVFAIAISFYMTPFLGDMAVPVVVYIAVISSMAATASVSKLVNIWGILGVYSFIISDLLIAWNRFIDPVPMPDLLIMGSYYFAQSAIFYNIILKANQRADSIYLSEKL